MAELALVIYAVAVTAWAVFVTRRYVSMSLAVARRSRALRAADTREAMGIDNVEFEPRVIKGGKS